MTSPSMAVSSDIPPDNLRFIPDYTPEAGNPQPVSQYSCEVCSAPLEYAGRGRKPTRCAEHKKTAAKGSARGSASTLALVERAVTEFSHAYSMLGTTVSAFASPIAGELVSERKDDLAESWRPLLETNAKFRELFAKTEKGIAWLPVIAVHGDLAVAIMLAYRMEAMKAAAESPNSVGL